MYGASSISQSIIACGPIYAAIHNKHRLLAQSSAVVVLFWSKTPEYSQTKKWKLLNFDLHGFWFWLLLVVVVVENQTYLLHIAHSIPNFVCEKNRKKILFGSPRIPCTAVHHHPPSSIRMGRGDGWWESGMLHGCSMDHTIAPSYERIHTYFLRSIWVWNCFFLSNFDFISNFVILFSTKFNNFLLFVL